MLDDMVESDDEAPLRPRDRHPAVTPWRRVAIIAAIIGAALVITGGTIAVVHFTNPLTVLASAQDLEQATESVEGGGSATVAWSDSLGKASITPEGLGPLPEHFVYQAWLVGVETRPAGILSGEDTLLLDARLEPGDEIQLTIEPEGGSAIPTTEPILTVPTS
jgi:hypothetical protein